MQSSEETYLGKEALQKAVNFQSIHIKKAEDRSEGFNKYIAYVIENPNQQKNFERRYRQFFAFRETLVQNWPGCFIPSLPRKHMTGNTTVEITNERIPILNYFLSSLNSKDFLRESEEYKFFVESNCMDLEKYFKKTYSKLSYAQILSNMKKNFGSKYIYSRESSAQVQSKVADILVPMEQFCKESKIQLVNFEKQISKLIRLLENYLFKLQMIQNQTFPQLQGQFGQAIASKEQSNQFLGSSQNEKSVLNEENLSQNKAHSEQQAQIIQNVIEKELNSEKESETEGIQNQKQSLFSQVDAVEENNDRDNCPCQQTNPKIYTCSQNKSKIQEKSRNIYGEVMKKQYQIILNCIHLEVVEMQSLSEVFESIDHLKRQAEIIRKKILTNEEQKQDIRNQKFSLRSFWKTNKEEIVREIQKENLYLEKEQQCMTELIFLSNCIAVKEAIKEYSQRRERFWKIALSKNIEAWASIANVVQSLYNMIVSMTKS